MNPSNDKPVTASSPRGWASRAPVLAGLLAAACLVPMELLAFVDAPAVWPVTISLLAFAGLCVGSWIAFVERIIVEWQLRGWPAAIARGMGSLWLTVPTAAHLFEGAFASTLPGSEWAHVWVPGLILLAVVVSLRLCQRWLDGRSRRRLVVLSWLAAVAIEVVNQVSFRSEYPDVHTFLTFCALTVLTLGFVPWLAALELPVRSARRRLRIWSGVTLTAFVVTSFVGMADASSRLAVASQGLHTRLLVRLVRAIADIDRDGYAAILSGGDCQELDATIHPGAREIPGNAEDENCDGIVLEHAFAGSFANAELERLHTSPAAFALLRSTRQANIILIAVDALRADVLEPSPEREADFPHLSRLFDESRVFSRAFAPASGTDLSLSGLLTGKIDPFNDIRVTLAEAMQASGRATHGVIPSEVLRYVGKTLPTRGLDGYDRLINDKHQRDVGTYSTSKRTTDLGLAFVDRQVAETRPFFLWLHYFDVHEHDELPRTEARVREKLGGNAAPSKREKYRAMLAIVDDEIGRLRKELETRGVEKNTIFVFVSDHGESLGEHARLPDNHGRYLYNALVHIPLAIRIPNTTAATSDAPVSLLDVYPTLVELSGARLGQVDGHSLLPFLLPEPTSASTSRPLPLNESDQYGVIWWPHKLLVRPKENLIELFDLGSDFAETRDLARAQRERVGELMSIHATFPEVTLDRTRRGRARRERDAKRDAPPQ